MSDDKNLNLICVAQVGTIAFLLFKMTRCTARSWFILCFIFPHLQVICGFANHGELELMEKISILENKVSKMEENEEQLRATIHTLFETSATARQANSVPENTVNNLVNLFEYHQTGGKDICLKSKFRLCDGLEKVRPADSNRGNCRKKTNENIRNNSLGWNPNLQFAHHLMKKRL